MLSASLSEKFVKQLMKFVGSEIENTRHLGFYASWSHSLLRHHGLWIKRKSRDLLPVLNHLQKSLTNKTTDLKDLCERNVQTVNFLMTISELRRTSEGAKHTEEEEEASVDS